MSNFHGSKFASKLLPLYFHFASMEAGFTSMEVGFTSVEVEFISMEAKWKLVESSMKDDFKEPIVWQIAPAADAGPLLLINALVCSAHSNAISVDYSYFSVGLEQRATVRTIHNKAKGTSC